MTEASLFIKYDEFASETVKVFNSLNRFKNPNLVSYLFISAVKSVGTTINKAIDERNSSDYIAKLEEAIKEIPDVSLWLEVLHKTDYINDQEYRILYDKCGKLHFHLNLSICIAKL